MIGSMNFTVKANFQRDYFMRIKSCWRIVLSICRKEKMLKDLFRLTLDMKSEGEGVQEVQNLYYEILKAIDL